MKYIGSIIRDLDLTTKEYITNNFEVKFTKNTAFNKNFSTTATDIKMNGSQSLGELTTLARADHVHPVDTSRAASSHTHGTYDNSTALTGANVYSNISITDGIVTGLTTRALTAANVGAAPTSHSHGDIANGGTITATAVTPANTDYLLISDTSASGKIARGIAIGTSTSTYLRNDGTWVTPPNTTYTASSFDIKDLTDSTNLRTTWSAKADASHNHTLDSLSNVTITTNATGEILKWNGTAWINNTLAEAGISAVGHTHSYDNYGSWTIKDGGTTTYTVTSGDVLQIAAGTGISSIFTADDVLTITNTAPNVTTDISITHNASDISVNSSDGTDGTINAATTSLAGVMTSTDKTKLNGIATGAEVNQNAFSNIAVSGQTTVAADAKTDTLTLIAGNNIAITTNATNDSVTISNISLYATCATAAATAAKTAAMTGFILYTGAVVYIKFTYANTAANPTLNINSTGAKPLTIGGVAMVSGHLVANRVYAFIYDGTNYEPIFAPTVWE